MFKYVILGLCLISTSLWAADDSSAVQHYRVIDNSYTVCKTQVQYEQLLKWSLYGVGSPPQTGCLPAPANAKAIILQCPENDIIICQFKLTPEDGSPVLNVWASKVMLMPVTPSVTKP
jgi:hypothetical protein